MELIECPFSLCVHNIDDVCELEDVKLSAIEVSGVCDSQQSFDALECDEFKWE